MIESSAPELTARIDVLMLALVTTITRNADPGYAAVLNRNFQTWRDFLIASRVPEKYLEHFDERCEAFLEMLHGSSHTPSGA
ncbi:hypothetical protein ACU4GD_43305 [Cupriavidus basilensis]